MSPTNEEEKWDQCISSLFGELKNKIIDAVNAMPKMSTMQIQYNFSVVISRRLDQITICLDYAQLGKTIFQEKLMGLMPVSSYCVQPKAELHIHMEGGTFVQHQTIINSK